jgi:predicted unusual protein kinase regulating ubiquinone biosynthesis (AarF/ABC1/UbiB family)
MLGKLQKTKIIYHLSKIIFHVTTYLYFLKVHKMESHYLADKIIDEVKNGGNIFWKLSQWITARAEFQNNLDNNYLINQLKVFYDKCPPHDFIVTKNALERYFKKPINDIFEYINETPEAVGSIGQVHKAKYKGKEVAIKVRHNDIRENIEFLVDSLKYLKSLSHNWLKNKISFDLSEIDSYLLNQTDFNNEAENLIKLKFYFKDIDYVYIPEVFEYNDEILIMEYVEGESVDKFYENKSKKEHWEMMIKFWLFIRESVLMHNYFHADLHKGNWKIKDEKIVIYDLGIILCNPESFDTNVKIWRGFECRCPKILANVIKDNIINNSSDNFEKDMIEYMEKRMDRKAVDFVGDIRNMLDFLNKNNAVLNCRALTYLLAFNLATANFKNFAFVDDNDKTYFESHLDRFALLKDKSRKYNNLMLYNKLQEDEEIFMDVNKEELGNINKLKDEKLKLIENILDDLSSESEQE